MHMSVRNIVKDTYKILTLSLCWFYAADKKKIPKLSEYCLLVGFPVFCLQGPKTDIPVPLELVEQLSTNTVMTVFHRGVKLIIAGQ